MKYLVMIGMLLMVAGCTTSTEFGKCTGLNGGEDPKLRYEYNAKNIIIGAVFSSLIIPPVLVGLNEYQCPVGLKDGK